MSVKPPTDESRDRRETNSKRDVYRGLFYVAVTDSRDRFHASHVSTRLQLSQLAKTVVEGLVNSLLA